MKKFEFSLGQNFEAVIKACARVKRHNQNGTWINKDYIKSYTTLHHLGFALSVEVWQNSELVGGLYGVYLPPLFFGESMFSTQTDASKAALAYLTHKCDELKISVIDCQQATPHLISLGAREISKESFLTILKRAFPQ